MNYICQRCVCVCALKSERNPIPISCCISYIVIISQSKQDIKVAYYWLNYAGRIEILYYSLFLVYKVVMKYFPREKVF